jgi:hypothetical protein
MGGVRSHNSPSRDMFIKASANNSEGGVDGYGRNIYSRKIYSCLLEGKQMPILSLERIKQGIHKVLKC